MVLYSHCGLSRKLDVAAIAGVASVVVRADGRFAMVSAAARHLLGRNGRMPRSWHDTILTATEAGHLATVARRVGKGGVPTVQVVGVASARGSRRLEVRLHPGAKPGEVAVLFTEIVHGGQAITVSASQMADQAMAAEVQHRVRNALQVMSALVHLETGDAAAARLEPVHRRILAMAQVHDSLDVRGGVAVVDLSACIRSVHAVSYGDVAGVVPLAVEVDGTLPAVSLDVAVPVALVVHEALMAGATPHVAPVARLRGLDGSVRVDLNGVSLGGAFQGSRLVAAMVRQAGIELTVAANGLSLTFSP